MTKASEQLESRRRERAYEVFRREWWWFDPANQQHIHEFSAAWEILRRTSAYRGLRDRMTRHFAQYPTNRTGRGSVVDVIEKGKLFSELPTMLPQSPPAPKELREMASRWQNMIANGWTPEKTYLEASRDSRAECVLPDGKIIRIPPTFDLVNRGIPVILPRQAASRGHTTVFVELCDVALAPGQAPKVLHLAGSIGATQLLILMHKLGMSAIHEIEGKFIAIKFPLHHPPQALKALVKSYLDRIEQSKAWDKPKDQPDQYSRGPDLISGTSNPLEAIAFFRADNPRNVIERGFRTLIRPEGINQVLPKIRKEWIRWESAELAKCDLDWSQTQCVKAARDAWDTEMRYGQLAPQSKVRPIKPQEDLDNLACADVAPFWRSRQSLPNALPDRLRREHYLNKKIATGRRLINSVDDVFLPILTPS